MATTPGGNPEPLAFHRYGRQRYEPIFEAMKAFTDARDGSTPDQCWLLEHEPVFTQGQAGRAEHVLAPGDIPVVQVDRGGQVTYHGPGQLMVYPLIDLARLHLGVRDFVSLLESVTVATLARWDVEAAPRRDAPGVYVAGQKIASLGLRVRRGRAYHGLAINVDMDLTPFQRINPCGYAGMPVTRLSDLTSEPVTLDDVAEVVEQELCYRLREKR